MSSASSRSSSSSLAAWRAALFSPSTPRTCRGTYEPSSTAKCDSICRRRRRRRWTALGWRSWWWLLPAPPTTWATRSCCGERRWARRLKSSRSGECPRWRSCSWAAASCPWLRCGRCSSKVTTASSPFTCTPILRTTKRSRQNLFSTAGEFPVRLVFPIYNSLSFNIIYINLHLYLFIIL